VKRICKVMEVCACSIFLKNNDRTLLRTTSYGVNRRGITLKKSDFVEQETYSIGISDCITGKIYDEGQSKYINNIQELMNEAKNNNSLIRKINTEAVLHYSKKISITLQNAIFSPLIVEGEKIGVLRALQKRRLDHLGGNNFDDDDLTAFDALAGLVAIAINNSNIIKKLKDTQRSKSELIDLYAHNLKNRVQPLTSVSNRFKKGKTGEFEIQILTTETQRLKTIVDTMLLLSRQETGKEIVPVLKHIDLKKLLKEVCTAYHFAAQDKSMKFKLEISDDFPESCQLDEEMIRDSLMNLIDNAIKFGLSDSIITIVLKLEQSNIIVSIGNKGQLIQSSEIETVFNQYYKSPKSTGTGIGLAHVRLVSIAHGGKVYIDPEYKLGIRIIMSIPLNPETY